MSATILLLALAGALAPADPPVVGHWIGAIEREGALLPIAVDVAERDDALACSVDVPTWGMFALPSRVEPREGGVSIAFGGSTLDLDLDAEAGALRGALLGPGGAAEDPPLAVELTRALAPIRPAIVEEEMRFESADGVTLAGSLLLPASGDRCPGIVLVQGRTYGDRLQFRSHGVLAARRGFAAFCFDGRGAGESGGVRGEHTLANRLEDAEAALALLRSHPRVDPERVGMFGHSAGGWVAPVVARRTGTLSFLVLHSGPAVPLAEQQGHVVRELARRSGAELTPEELDAAYRFRRDLTALAVDGAPWSELEALVREARGERWAPHAFLPDGPDDVNLDYYRRNPHDSTEALRALEIPVLALFGEEDVVVPPAENVPVLRSALAGADGADLEVVVFPGANHDLFVGPVEREGEPYRWMRRPPGYFEALFDWLERRVR